MRKITPSTKIAMGRSRISGAGRGIFAQKAIKRNEVIEVCPVLVVPRQDQPKLKKTVLYNYYFKWGKVTCGVCFGFGSLYNHSYKPNATYRKDIKNQVIRFIAIKNIAKDEEITVNYNYGDPRCQKPLWWH